MLHDPYLVLNICVKQDYGARRGDVRQNQCHQLDSGVMRRCKHVAAWPEQTGQRQEQHGGNRRRQQAAIKAPCVGCHLFTQFHALKDDKLGLSVPGFYEMYA